jgi:hypothetical protein
MIESKQLDHICHLILNLDKNIQSVLIINWYGRIIENLTRDEFTKNFPDYTNEMLLMQCVLQVTMDRDFDDNLSPINYHIADRENLTMITFPLIDHIVLVMTNKKTNSMSLAQKTVGILKIYRKNFFRSLTTLENLLDSKNYEKSNLN